MCSYWRYKVQKGWIPPHASSRQIKSIDSTHSCHAATTRIVFRKGSFPGAALQCRVLGKFKSIATHHKRNGVLRPLMYFTCHSPSSPISIFIYRVVDAYNTPGDGWIWVDGRLNGRRAPQGSLVVVVFLRGETVKCRERRMDGKGSTRWRGRKWEGRTHI